MLWKEEVALITAAALARMVDPLLIMAIRRAECGGPGSQFGIEVPGTVTYDQELLGCVGTVRHRLTLFPHNPLDRVEVVPGVTRLIYGYPFLSFLASTYCPVGAENDPEGLNKNWLGNVYDVYAKMVIVGPLVASFEPELPLKLRAARAE